MTLPERPSAQRRVLHEQRAHSSEGGRQMVAEVRILTTDSAHFSCNTYRMPLHQAERHGQPLHSFRWGVIRGQQPDAGDGLAQAGTVSTFAAGLSFLPTFFGLPFANTTEQGGQAAEGLSPEQAQQALLSRLLLLLGSMVILCLLLF